MFKSLMVHFHGPFEGAKYGIIISSQALGLARTDMRFGWRCHGVSVDEGGWLKPDSWGHKAAEQTGWGKFTKLTRPQNPELK